MKKDIRKTGRLIPVLLVGWLVSCFDLQAQEELEVFWTNKGHVNVWEYYRDAPYQFYYHLAGEAFAQLDERKARINSIRTLDEWKLGQSEIREKDFNTMIRRQMPRGSVRRMVNKTSLTCSTRDSITRIF